MVIGNCRGPTPGADELPLALALLVAGVVANDPHHALAADHLALVADSFDAGANLHLRTPKWLGPMIQRE